MGNRLGRRRHVVDEKYTRPQGLYLHKDVDYKKLRKLILDSKLAPCYPGVDECATDLEECPICFLYYPSVNRSRCCMKGICTECFLQMMPPNSTHPIQCPFCKTSNYAVEYRGFRTKEEKGMEEFEEQKVIEAKIRMQQQEHQIEYERVLRRHETGSSSAALMPNEVECPDISNNIHRVPSFSFPTLDDNITPFQDLPPRRGYRCPSNSRQNRGDEFDLDLEEIMVMEATWRSIQDQRTSSNQPLVDAISEPFVSEDRHVSLVATPGESASSCGLACAIDTFAEHSQMQGDGSLSNASGNMPTYMLAQSRGPSYTDERITENYPSENWIEVLPSSGRAIQREGSEWALEHESGVAEVGTNYASSDAAINPGTTLVLSEAVGDVFQPQMAGPITPESFHEQMMLAMAVSFTDARAQTNLQGLAWH